MEEVHSYDKLFQLEQMRLNALRSRVLMWLFLSGTAFVIFSFFYYGRQFNNNEDALTVNFIALTYTLGIAVYEYVCILYFRKCIRRRMIEIPMVQEVSNVFIETLSPSILIYLIADKFINPIDALQFSFNFLYFLFIILSTLRLNIYMSVLTGVISAFGYFTVSFIVLSGIETRGETSFTTYDILGYVAKSFILLLAGLGAAFVTDQIRKSINRTLKTQAEENKIISLFGQQVSREIVDEMLSSNIGLQSKLMHVSVMFIDIRNFTASVGQKSPGEIVNYQNTFFKIVIDSVNIHGGIINQFLGDGCMVTFGAPQPLENPSAQAVKAALEIKEEMERQMQAGVLPPTDIGIGIHTGEAVTGNIGSESRMQYSITGSVVILASRIEQLNKKYDSKVLISAEVLRKSDLNGNLNPERIGPVDLKGWDEPLEIYKLA